MDHTRQTQRFVDRRLQQELDKYSVDQLKELINQGLDELLVLVKTKPKNWHLEIDPIEKTLRRIKEEIEKRETIIV